jgi:hypothetical protein
MDREPKMKTSRAVLITAAFVALAACGKKDEQTTADTSVIKAADTVKPTADTVVQTTTTKTDTIKGKPADSTKADTTRTKTTRKPASTKKKGGY